MNSKNVKIMIGSHGSGKSDWIYNRFINMSRNEDGKVDFSKKFYLIVPEQDTNERQRIMMEKSKELGTGAGIINIDVVSFDRIAHIVFDKLMIEPPDENVVDDDVKTMILSLVLSRLSKEGKLKYCNSQVGKIGFASKLTKAMSEFYAYNVTEGDIDKVLKDSRSDAYRDKLQDFKLIFNEFKKVLIDLHFSIKEDKYDLLSKKILETDIFNGSIVAFDGFTGFTPIQLEILKKITSVASESIVSIDMRDPKSVENITKDTMLDMEDVFYLSKKFVKDLVKIVDAKSASDLIYEDSIKDKIYKFDSDLAFLEAHLYADDGAIFDGEVKNIKCFSADSIKDEVRNAIEIIVGLVRREGYRYNDIKIMVPSIDDYRDTIIKAFAKYNIPLFIDDSENVIGSPYIECVRAAIDVVRFNFSYDSVMRFLGSGIIEKNKDIYEFSGFLTAHAIRGYDRYKTGIGKILENANDLNKSRYHSVEVIMGHYINPLLSLYEEINKKDGQSIMNYVTSLLKFTNDINLDEEMTSFMRSLEVSGDAKDVKKIALITDLSKKVLVNTIKNIETLEKYKEFNDIKGISNVSLDEFKSMLDIGLSSKSLKSIPYSLDQVVVGDLTRTRFENPKFEIFLGLNDSTVPKRNTDGNLIDDTMRELFSYNVKELSQTTIETALNQRFYIYLALTNPTDRLILSYSKKSRDGEADKESQVLTMIKGMYDGLNVESVNPSDFSFLQDSDLFSCLASNMQSIKKYHEVDESGKAVNAFTEDIEKDIEKAENIYKYLHDNGLISKSDEDILLGKYYSEEKTLNENICKDLHDLNDNKYETSATSVESYNRCPYRYFMEHTLKLREEKSYSVEAYDVGNIAHKVFEDLFSDKKILDMNESEIDSKVDRTLDKEYEKQDVFNEFNKKDKDYYGSNKLEYIKLKMRKLLHTASSVLVDVSRASRAKVDGTELSFTYDISGDDKKKIMVGGKIDRIDICEVDGVPYVSIIDYKSGRSEKKIDRRDIENGTNIQLTLYMDYCLNEKYKSGSVEPKFVGLFYYWVADPFERPKDVLTPDAIASFEKKKSGLGGVANDNEEVLAKAFRNIECKKKKDGQVKDARLKDGYKVGNAYIEKAELDNYIEIMRQKVSDTVASMNEGRITATKAVHTCEYCAYSNICRKDRMIEKSEDSID